MMEFVVIVTPGPNPSVTVGPLRDGWVTEITVRREANGTISVTGSSVPGGEGPPPPPPG